MSHDKLVEFWRRHADSRSSLESWYHLVSTEMLTNLTEVRRTFPHADAVEGLTVFNTRGNRYRLITRIDYQDRRIYVRELLTHAEYSRGHWRGG